MATALNTSKGADKTDDDCKWWWSSESKEDDRRDYDANPTKEQKEEFIGRWQADGSTVLERNKYMFNNPVMSDIKFAFPDKPPIYIPAHKYVLAISSPVFFAMFYGDLAEKRETIDITDCDPEVFLQFLRYLYYDDTNFGDVNRAILVWCTADKYDVPSLAKECVKFIDASMDPLTAFDIIPHARRFNHQDLEKVCWEVIDYNAQEIVADDSFLELKHEVLLSFFERSSLRIGEVKLFKAVDRWAERRCKEGNMTIDGAHKRSVLGEDLVKLVRFSLMSPREFSDVVLPTEILSTTEVIDVFKRFTSVPIPGGLKFSTRPRVKNDATLQSCSMGRKSETRRTEKVGVLTFTVNKPITLCGVKIITDKVKDQPVSCCVNLSVALRGEKIRQIKDRYVTNSRENYYQYGEVDVFFNRPFWLSSNTCCTIETERDTSENHSIFCWSASLQSRSLRQETTSPTKTTKDEKSILSGHCSGLYTECIPRNVCYMGEITELLYK